MTKTAEQIAPQVEVGSIFVSSWGYDQTNIDYYEVVSRTAKSVRVVEIQKEFHGHDGGSSDKVGPKPGHPKVGASVKVEGGWSEYRSDAIAQPETKRLKVWTSGDKETVAFTVNSYSSAYLTTPEATHHQTDAFSGH